MPIEKLYRLFLTFKTVSELAYLLGTWIGQRKRRK